MYYSIMEYESIAINLIKYLTIVDLLREGEDSFSCMCIPWPGGRAGSSSTMSPQELFWRHDSRAARKTDQFL